MSPTLSTILTIVLIVLAVAAVILIVLYFVGRKMQGNQAEQQAMMEANKQIVSMLIIDKKKMKIKDAGFPKLVEDNLPWYGKFMKYPVVKAKVGPKILTLMADPGVFDLLPIKTECKVSVSGIYITDIKSVRGGSIQRPKKKENIFSKMRSKAQARLDAARKK